MLARHLTATIRTGKFCAVDTNVLVRLVTRDDAKQVALAKELVATGAWVSHLVVEAALGRYRRKPSLGFSDCLVLEIARKAGHLPLGTFDRDLGKLPGARRL